MEMLCENCDRTSRFKQRIIFASVHTIETAITATVEDVFDNQFPPNWMLLANQVKQSDARRHLQRLLNNRLWVVAAFNNDDTISNMRARIAAYISVRIGSIM